MQRDEAQRAVLVRVDKEPSVDRDPAASPGSSEVVRCEDNVSGRVVCAAVCAPVRFKLPCGLDLNGRLRPCSPGEAGSVGFRGRYDSFDRLQQRQRVLGFLLAVRQKHGDDQGGYLAATPQRSYARRTK